MEKLWKSLAVQIDWRRAEIELQTPIDFVQIEFEQDIFSEMVGRLVDELRLKSTSESNIGNAKWPVLI